VDAAVNLLNKYSQENLKAGADKNRIAIVGMGTTDFLRKEFGWGMV